MAVSVETTQNVTLEYDIASVGDRILAAIVDVFVLVSYVVILVLISDAIAVSEAVSVAIVIVFYLPIFLYDLLCEVFLDGQSIGKKALRIKVVKLDGTEPTLGSYLLRWILRLVDTFFMLGLLVMAISGKGQRIGDIAAGTTVIKLRPRISLSDVLMPTPDVAYVPQYPEVIRLSDRDIAIVREVWSAMRSQSTHATINALAERVAAVMGVEAVLQSPQYQGPDKFLEVVLRDYAFLTSGDERVIG